MSIFTPKNNNFVHLCQVDGYWASWDVRGLDATVAVRVRSNCKTASLFLSKPSPLSFLQPFLSICHRPSVDSDFCVADLYFFFLFCFFCLCPSYQGCLLAAWQPPCVKGGCGRTDCGNSRLASPAPHPEGQPSIQRTPLFLHAHTHVRTQAHPHTQMANPTRTGVKSLTTLTASPQ